jgi:septum formation protein
MFFKNLKDQHIILASQSPRRQNLLKEIGIEYTILVKEGINEEFPDHLKKEEIAIYLAELKSRAYLDEINANNIVITADTIVWVNDGLLGKPADRADAIRILNLLSGNKHTVYTGVCISSSQKQLSFYAETDVYFRTLDADEIEHYIDTCQPFDKSGSYGIQEWIGYVAIEKIEGSYFNVMGLPIQKLYEELRKF